MMECPISPDRPLLTICIGSNCFRCSTCNELVFSVRDPFDATSVFPAFSNANSEFRSIPDDILLHKIVDQSPIEDPPRNMIIEFADGASVLLIQADSANVQYTKGRRIARDKPASALKHDLLHAYLPVELMERIRSATITDSA